MASNDPRTIRSIAVTAEDVVIALEANERGGPRTVLRVTPPFSGRMRARIHRPPERGPADRTSDLADDGPVPGTIHLPPERLVADPPAYPSADDTEDALRADPDGSYTPDRHRERHVAAVERWRAEVRDSIVDAVPLELPGGPHRIEVRTLG